MTKSTTTIAAASGTAAVMAITLLAGCGGGASTGARDANNPSAASAAAGRAQITVLWPNRTSGRKIPVDAGSIQVNFRQGDTIVQSQLLVRPDRNPTPSPSGSGGIGPQVLGVTRGTSEPTSTTFFDLPAGAYRVEAIAYPNADGTGTVQGTAQGDFTIVAGSTVPVRLSLATTITRVDILPQNVPFTTEPVPLTAVAYDANDALVLTSQWNWTNSDASVVSLVVGITDPAKATVQLVGFGESTVTATEGESGLSAAKLFRTVSQSE